jgi:sterol desaturase/sphingolipid hydroxylase (fatty acid hydroxylase superfamily)
MTDRGQRFRALGAGLSARREVIVVGLLVALLSIVVVTAPSLLTAHLDARQLPHSGSLILQNWRDTLLSPWYLGLIVFVLVLERTIPARVGEGFTSVGAAQDFVWLLLFGALQLTIVRCYYVLLQGASERVFDGFSIHVAAVLGSGGAVAFAFVATDFLNWFTHYARHRVPALWHFHEIHHSQREMNMFTNERVHFVEAMVASTLVFVPAALFDLPGKQIVAIATASLLYQRFFHANVRTNLGPLRHVLVTPQSHRVHHAETAEYYDTNFGVVFSVWDRLFRTRHADDHSYPRVGVADAGVPQEQSRRPMALAGTYVKQLVYPFRAVHRLSVQRRRPAPNQMQTVVTR